MRRLLILLMFIAACVSTSLPGLGADEAVNFQPACKAQPILADPHAFTATCEIGPIGGMRVARVTYRHDGSPPPAAEATFLPFDLAGRQAAILFVVDRSDKRRARTIALGAGDAVRLADATRGVGTYRFGLATMLGDRLDVVAPIGSTRDDLSRSASAVHADAIEGDESHPILDAIKLLAQAPGDRHILVLATDGKPEDKALATDDVIHAARNAGVVVIGIGYRERTGDGPELGSLKRLAEETGGFYAEPLLPATRIEDAVVTRFGQFVGSGGLATFPLDKADPRGKYQITVDIDGGRALVGTYDAQVSLPGLRSAPVRSSAAVAGSSPNPAQGPKPAANAPAQVLATQPVVPTPEPVDPGSLQAMAANVMSPVYGIWRAHPLTVIGATLGLILVIVGVTSMMMRRAGRIKVFAWIELLDQRRTRFAVTKPGIRLGRHSDNDIRFRDKSVHRYHAVLQRDAGTGSYQITDLSRNQARSNGVMVNGELVHEPVVLANGDTIELGEVSFRFVYT